jgi:hypothetical protein
LRTCNPPLNILLPCMLSAPFGCSFLMTLLPIGGRDRGDVERKHSTDVEFPRPPLCVCMSINVERKM